MDVAVVRICCFALRFPLLALKGWEALLIVGHSRHLSADANTAVGEGGLLQRNLADMMPGLAIYTYIIRGSILPPIHYTVPDKSFVALYTMTVLCS